MKTQWRSGICAMLLVTLLPMVNVHAAEEAAGAPAAAADAGAEQAQAEARALLMAMARYLSGLPAFTVNILSGYDVVQSTGQKIEFGESRDLTLVRPAKLRIEAEQSDGEQTLVVYDGKTMTVASPLHNAYAQSEVVGTIDEAVVHFKRDLHMRLPLAALLVSRLPQELESRVQSVDYVEETALFGEPADHLAVRTETVDFQVWIRTGDKPLPLRIVLNYKHEEGQPQFWAQFSDWKLNPATSAATFTYSPAAGASKIPFVAQIKQVTESATTGATQTGEKP